MKPKIQLVSFSIAGLIALQNPSYSCTGITLTAKDNSVVVARTIDWAGSEMNNIYVIVPRGKQQQSLLPNGTYGGKKFTAKYGFVGLGVQQPEFVIDGTNEAGLSAGLFYFPKYGKYRPYSEALKDKSIADFQVVSWILSEFATIDELKSAIDGVRIININPTASTTHWRITEPNGHQVVMEIIDGVATFHENPVGVLANAPDFRWQETNLNSYVNLYPGTAKPQKFGPITLESFSGSTGLLGLPGDFSSPSRFVRAAFLKTSAIQQSNGYQSVMQSFHLLNNLDEPFGFDWAPGTAKFDMPSATQWTIASDITNRKIYYHTMYNRTIREIDMNQIDFTNVLFQYHPLDETKQETIIPIRVTSR
ncbi:MAG: choloylglycine hydrolase family protein [Alphaproteobacteria bacterium]|nr:choloylglycine hydrolase family protein [Alphaproteobacteria bacterium]